MLIISILGLKKGDPEYEKALLEAVKILRSDGVIIHSTETCYGLAANIFNEIAVKKIYEIKKMPLSKPLSILVSSVDEAKKYGQWNDLAEKYAKQYWPGPLTLILKRTDFVPKFLNPKTDTIGIRFPSHEFSIALVKLLGNPVITTSANISGDPPSYSFAETLISAGLGVDDGNLDPSILPSTIVDISEGTPILVRTGPVAIPFLLDAS